MIESSKGQYGAALSGIEPLTGKDFPAYFKLPIKRLFLPSSYTFDFKKVILSS